MKLQINKNLTIMTPELAALNAPLLILGAAHSGKSELATSSLDLSKKATVIGTADHLLDDLGDRLGQLKKSRPIHWNIIEGVNDLPAAFAKALSLHQPILVDSLNQYIATSIVYRSQQYSYDQIRDQLQLEFEQLGKLIQSAPPELRIVFVSSEIAAGLSPPRPAARLYRQISSSLNRKIALICRTVVLVSAGIPVVIKSQ